MSQTDAPEWADIARLARGWLHAARTARTARKSRELHRQYTEAERRYTDLLSRYILVEQQLLKARRAFDEADHALIEFTVVNTPQGIAAGLQSTLRRPKSP